MLRNIRLTSVLGATGNRPTVTIEDLDHPGALQGSLVQSVAIQVGVDGIPQVTMTWVPRSVEVVGAVDMETQQATPAATAGGLSAQRARDINQSFVQMITGPDPDSRATALSALTDYLNTRYREVLTADERRDTLGDVLLTLPIPESIIPRDRTLVSDIRQLTTDALASIFQRMQGEHFPAIPAEGVGRIRRESYRIFFGEWNLDVDECRTHAFPRHLLDAMTQWNPPPTPAELIWVADLLRGYLPGTVNESFRRLFALAQAGPRWDTAPQPRGAQPVMLSPLGVPLATYAALREALAAQEPPRAGNQRSIQLDHPGRPPRVQLDI